MNKNSYICLTIDVDPDDLNGEIKNRNSISFEFFEKLKKLVYENINEKFFSKITWFVRADLQIEKELGAINYLFEKHQSFWEFCLKAGHEIAWHPHLYKVNELGNYELIVEQQDLEGEIFRLWQNVKKVPFLSKSFRNGEAFMNNGILKQIESIGFTVDSTAIPGRVISKELPHDWLGTPNHPFYQSYDNYRIEGSTTRSILEIPMNTWDYKTSYDKDLKKRYINPTIHSKYFIEGVKSIKESIENYDCWTLIFHPNELVGGTSRDLLYAFDFNTFKSNMSVLENALIESQKSIIYSTLQEYKKNYDNK